MSSSRKKECSLLFSETIKKTMKEMGAEKSRPQVIAISAKRTIQNHPECRRYLDRPQERIPLDNKHWIIWSSKSFRLYRSKPCSIRVFFRKKEPSSRAWKKSLKMILEERLGVRVRLGNPSGSHGENFLEIGVSDPKLILSLLNHRVAGFLD